MTNKVVIERTYDQRSEAVFNAWVDVDLLRQWFGCGPETLWDVHEWDVVVGGRLRVSMEMDGGPVEVIGEFLDIDPPHRLRYKWGDDQTVTAEFVAVGSGCKLIVTHDHLPDEMTDVVTEGWTTSLTQLAPIVV